MENSSISSGQSPGKQLLTSKVTTFEIDYVGYYKWIENQQIISKNLTDTESDAGDICRDHERHYSE